MWLPKSRKVIVSRDVKFINEGAFDREYQEFLEEEKPQDTKARKYKQAKEPIEDRTEKHHREAPQTIVTRERRATEGSTPLPPQFQPSKRGRGRPALLRSGSVRKPRKLYHTITHRNEENENEDSDTSNR